MKKTSLFWVKEVQPWEASEEYKEEEDLEELRLKAEEDAKDAPYDSFMGMSQSAKESVKAPKPVLTLAL